MAAVVSSITGAWITHKLSLSLAPTKTVAQTETLLGLAKSALDLAQSTNVTPKVLAKLQELQSQARAVQTGLQLLQTSNTNASFQPDFWLAAGKGAVLGGTTSFGVTSRVLYQSSAIRVQLNSRRHTIEAGDQLEYKASDKTCYVNYLGASPDDTLFGFKIVCDT